jgi:hypothetical protein
VIVVSFDAERGRKVSGNGCGFCYFIQAMDPYSQERMCDDGREHAKVPHWAIVPHIESCKAQGGRPTSSEEAKD